jgi:hypothetical protein
MKCVTFVATYAGVLAKYSRDLTSLAAEGKLDQFEQCGHQPPMNALVSFVVRRCAGQLGQLGQAPTVSWRPWLGQAEINNQQLRSHRTDMCII